MFLFKPVVMNSQDHKLGSSNLPPSDPGQNLRMGSVTSLPAARPGTVVRAGTSCPNKVRGEVGGNHQEVAGPTVIQTDGSQAIGQALINLDMIENSSLEASGNRSMTRPLKLKLQDDRTG